MVLITHILGVPWNHSVYLETPSGANIRMVMKERKLIFTEQNTKQQRIPFYVMYMTMMFPVLFVWFATDPLSRCFQVRVKGQWLFEEKMKHLVSFHWKCDVIFKILKKDMQVF